MSRKRQGFTLIELLVVIAIIAILAAILLPVFSRARKNARKTQCMSNMKQFGSAIMQYQQDYDEMYPNCQWHQELGLTYQRLNLVLDPYLKSKAVAICPEDAAVWTWGGQNISYGYAGPSGWNMPNNVAYSTADRIVGRTAAEIQSPAETWMVCDLWMYTHEVQCCTPPADNRYASNVCYADGHAKFNNKSNTQPL